MQPLARVLPNAPVRHRRLSQADRIASLGPVPVTKLVPDLSSKPLHGLVHRRLPRAETVNDSQAVAQTGSGEDLRCGCGVRDTDESNADALARQISDPRRHVDGAGRHRDEPAAVGRHRDFEERGRRVYLAGGPFSVLPQRRLWGVRVALSSAMPAVTALVGAFTTGAGLFRKGGIRVEASNSHSDFFVKIW